MCATPIFNHKIDSGGVQLSRGKGKHQEPWQVVSGEWQANEIRKWKIGTRTIQNQKPQVPTLIT
jgi:hypothetical protein